ncbi:MAG: hypothetical protein IJ583_12550 [Firmicutes bacterium]|nr:hypothetical protein [Bacillota bacterium]
MEIDLTGYVPNEKIIQCIHSNDLKGLREHIGMMAYTDRAFLHGEFEKAIMYVIKICGVRDLFEPFCSDPPMRTSYPDKNYNKEDFTKAVYELKKNFCKERIQDVKIIGRYVYYSTQIEAEKIAEIERQKKLMSEMVIKFPEKEKQNIFQKFIKKIRGED